MKSACEKEHCQKAKSIVQGYEMFLKATCCPKMKRIAKLKCSAVVD